MFLRICSDMRIILTHMIDSTNKPANHCQISYLTLPSGMPIDVAGQEPQSVAVLGSLLGLLEGEARPLGDVSF